jgi:hypothetical protein
MSRYSIHSHGDNRLPSGCIMVEENDADQDTYRVVTDATEAFKENRTSYMQSGHVCREHVVSEHGDEDSAVAACRMFCAVFGTEAWVEREQVWGDEEASSEEVEVICHLAFDEDAGEVTEA